MEALVIDLEKEVIVDFTVKVDPTIMDDIRVYF